jgi:hypothetical protein
MLRFFDKYSSVCPIHYAVPNVCEMQDLTPMALTRARHCEERSDAAISKCLILSQKIASSLRDSQ